MQKSLFLSPFSLFLIFAETLTMALTGSPEQSALYENVKPGEFVLQTLFLEFCQIAGKKIEQVLAEPLVWSLQHYVSCSWVVFIDINLCYHEDLWWSFQTMGFLNRPYKIYLLCVSYPSATEFSAILFLLFARSSSDLPRSFQRFRRCKISWKSGNG